MDSRLHYFAYGSNMWFERLRRRTPSLVNLGHSVLDNYALGFYKAGDDGSGKATIEAAHGHQVHGVLYTLSAHEKPILDEIEGVGFGYKLAEIEVQYAAKSISAFTYIGTQLSHNLLPYHWYKAFVVEGARQNKLPLDYLAQLEAVAAMDDPDAQRAVNNADILHNAANP